VQVVHYSQPLLPQWLLLSPDRVATRYGLKTILLQPAPPPLLHQPHPQLLLPLLLRAMQLIRLHLGQQAHELFQHLRQFVGHCQLRPVAGQLQRAPRQAPGQWPRMQQCLCVHWKNNGWVV